MVRRFTREAKLGASLNHPNLVWVYDTVVEDEDVLMVMEYVEGTTLRNEISSDPLRPRRAVEVVAAMASALEHAHERGVVHRDVKPANVLLGQAGAIKLADLGIATAADRTRITSSGQALGTASYMAPEQLEGERATPASDIYALSTVAFEALTGRKARPGRSAMEIAHAISSKPPPDLREAWQHAPAAAAEVLKRGMARQPERRPESACDLASELARALGEETTARDRLDAARAATGGALAAEPPTPREPRPAPAVAPAPRAPTPAPRSRTPDPPSPTPAPRSRTPDPPSTRQPSPPAQSRRAARLGRGVLIAAVALLALVVVVVVLASTGGDSSGERAQPVDAGGTGAPQADKGSGSAAPGGSGAGGAASAGDSGSGASGSTSGTASGGGSGPALNRQGFALLNQGKAAEAVPVLRRSVAAFPQGTTDVQYAYALYNLGHALRLSGHPQEAVPVLERRLRIPNQRAEVQKELDAARRAAG
jgi:serine/threonine-protein kinase